MKRTSLFLAVLLSTNVAKAEMLTSNHLYRYAQNKNYQALQKFSKWINITNKNKDTAICLALKDNNIEAYKLLLRYGANPRPSCLARINKYNNTNKNYHTSSSNSETFLGMGTTGWSITGGLLAAGGIAAVAGGGGGGGSSSGNNSGNGGGSSSGSGSNDNKDTSYLDKEPITDQDNGQEIVGKTATNQDPQTNNQYIANSNNGTIKKIVESENNVVGVASETAFVANATSFEGKSKADITIAQRGSGDIYGIKGPQSRHVNVIPEDEDDEEEGSVYNAVSAGGKAEGNITIRNTGKGTGNIYGMQSNADNIYIANAEADAEPGSATVTANILIENLNSDKNVYGISSNSDATNAEVDSKAKAEGYINIKNTGNGDVYGIKAVKETYNIDATEQGEAVARIDITNNGNGNVYGINNNDNLYNAQAGHYRWEDEDIDSSKIKATINIENSGNGDVYGLKSSSYVYNAYSYYDSNAEGKVRISNNGTGDAYGIYGHNIKNAYAFSKDENHHATAKGYVNIINKSSGIVYGLYSDIAGNTIMNDNVDDVVTQQSIIEMANVEDGLAVGIYSKDGNINNSGEITIHNLGSGTAVGIYADGTTKVTNTGTITITRDSYIDDNETPDDTSDDITYSAPNSKGGRNIGIYGTSTSQITNTGTIIISGAKTGYGIYIEKGGTLTNSGNIQIVNGNGVMQRTTGEVLFTNGRWYESPSTQMQTLNINLDNEINNLINNSDAKTISTQTTDYVFNLDDIGGEVIATENGTFEVEGDISGKLTMSSDIVSKGFEDLYTTKNTINAQDTSNLNLLSQSALFDASLAENNSDVNLKMKKFNDVVNNKSLADFLQNNYALENNETFYNTLKKQETTASLNEALNELTGKKLFSRFADEDLMMMRELTFDMNNKLFMNNDDHLETSGNISTFNFNGNSGSNSRYALINHNYGKYKLGLNYGFADVRSYDDDDDNRREEMMFHMGMPISYHKKGFKFITTPHIGYASGTYDRKGLNSENYDGHIEKTMFGLMNEVRYPIAFDKWTIAPSAEFNVVNYATKGHEKGGTNPLNLDLQHNYSVEAGLGLYANTEYKLGKQSKLSFTGGVAMYHEFADPYKLSIGMEGMSGKFDIRDKNRGDNRAVIRTGLKFANGNMSLGANVMSYIDREYRTNATLDFKYGF